MPGVTGVPIPGGVALAGGDAGEIMAEQEVLGRRVTFNATSLTPQFADPMVTGYMANEQTAQGPYDPPFPVAPSRVARMPRWFGVGIQRVLSVAAWPFLPHISDPDRDTWIGMTGVKLNKVSPGWDGPRKNIVGQDNMPYGSLTAIYPHVYATGEE